MQAEQQLVEALNEVMDGFISVLNLSVKSQDSDTTHNKQDDLVGFIGLTGGLAGSVAVSFDEQSAVNIVSKMLDVEVKPGYPDITDGVGEIANIIAGGMKNKMASTDYSFDISIPTVIEGKNLKLPSENEKISRITKVFSFIDVDITIILDYKVVDKSTETAEKKDRVSALNQLSSLIGDSQTQKIKENN